MSLQIASLREEYLEDAAALVSVRYKALREHVPLLPSRYEDIDAILHMLRDLTEAPGVVAIRGSRLVGFLLGIEGWQWLGFGLAAVDGVRELKPVEGGVASFPS